MSYIENSPKELMEVNLDDEVLKWVSLWVYNKKQQEEATYLEFFKEFSHVFAFGYISDSLDVIYDSLFHHFFEKSKKFSLVDLEFRLRYILTTNSQHLQDYYAWLVEFDYDTRPAVETFNLFDYELYSQELNEFAKSLK